MSQPETRRYTVRGMSCDHCRESVIEEVSEIHGVDAVDVDLATGGLQVSGLEFSDEDIETAVGEAGYEVVGASD